jgi:hypothetical protein
MLEKKHRACLAIKIQALVGADGVVRFSEIYPFAALILRSAVVLTLRGICNMAETWQEGFPSQFLTFQHLHSGEFSTGEVWLTGLDLCVNDAYVLNQKIWLKHVWFLLCWQFFVH